MSGDGVPTMGEEAETYLREYACSCGNPGTPGIMHRTDGPCYVAEVGARHVMTDEEWEINKDCDRKQRAHKWRWKVDITTGQPHATEAICVHCGISATLSVTETKIHAR